MAFWTIVLVEEQKSNPKIYHKSSNKMFFYENNGLNISYRSSTKNLILLYRKLSNSSNL